MRHLSTREDWLRACLTRVTAGWPAGADLPENTRISVGFPAKKGRGPVPVSEHYLPDDSAGGMYEIFISPTIAETVAVAQAVAMEAARIATGRSLGADEVSALLERARSVAGTLPPYPHAALKGGAGPVETETPRDRPGSRLLKAACTECGYTVRVTRKWLRVIVPSCPSGHGIMQVSDGRAAP